ncbi:hypothetical protein ACFUVV_04030 [Streptomyces sp. NPDC057376]|uniref:hypothetical protein n=1 Tax=unclassified Streptomyces TaxID=2593676 RepID=UPI00095E4B15|nr:hypothetical protein [Streptomyces sp. CB02414]OKI84133.1 hypothetical protein AMK11_22670 [Streptomyces sp. CB02414]
MEQPWEQMAGEHVSFDAHTVELPTAQAQDFGASVNELAAERDRWQIALMRALGATDRTAESA